VGAVLVHETWAIGNQDRVEEADIRRR